MDILTVNDPEGTYPPSWYAATATPLEPFEAAKGDIDCDVCIVGGGYTGLSSALHLAERGYNVVLLEAHKVGFGASGRNGGLVGIGQRVDQDELEKTVGITQARALWDVSVNSVDLVKSLISKYNIECDFASGIIHADHRARFVPESHAYVEHLKNAYGYKEARPLDRDEIRGMVGSENYHGGTLDMRSGHLHPLNYALGLARAARDAGARIYEKSRVVEISEGEKPFAKTKNAKITAKHIVIGGNGYLGDLNKKIARRVMPINNFIAATEPLSDNFAESLIRNNHAVADSRFVVNYFHLSHDRRMLFGGGETYSYRFPKDIGALVRSRMLAIYPQLSKARIDYAWGGTLGITMSRMPHFIRLTDNILNAGGFSGHGVAMATMAGQIVAEAVVGQAERFDLMANVPTPRFPGGIAFRWPLLVLAMTWYSLRDRL